jgi:hypothetical protein
MRKGVIDDDGAPPLQQHPQAIHGDGARLLPLPIAHALAATQASFMVDGIEADEPQTVYAMCGLAFSGKSSVAAILARELKTEHASDPMRREAD